MEKFDLEVAPEKTRILEFGRFTAEDRRGRGGLIQQPPAHLEFTQFEDYQSDKLFL